MTNVLEAVYVTANPYIRGKDQPPHSIRTDDEISRQVQQSADYFELTGRHDGDSAQASFACRLQVLHVGDAVDVVAILYYVNIMLPHVNSDDPHCIA